ncbi:hypothetical protein Sjap_012539 [Stephania japonica]|uniref:S-protein homolog n=1 Tax=Stephania japonica TaxID=461633 RepID=A0AAP0IW42_9MAGN
MRTLPYLCTAFLLCLDLCTSISFGKNVRVMNRLGQGAKLNVHCMSRDDDLGYRVVADGDEFGWNFNVNAIGTTLFYCDVQWEMGTWFHFDVYSASRDASRCSSECRWMIQRDGLYVFNQGKNLWEMTPFQPSRK